MHGESKFLTVQHSVVVRVRKLPHFAKHLDKIVYEGTFFGENPGLLLPCWADVTSSSPPLQLCLQMQFFTLFLLMIRPGLYSDYKTDLNFTCDLSLVLLQCVEDFVILWFVFCHNPTKLVRSFINPNSARHGRLKRDHQNRANRNSL